MNDTEIIATEHDPDKAVGEYRKQYSTYTRSQLILEMNRWLPHAAQHIAAKQLIDEMDKADSDRKHRNLLIIAALTLLAAVLTFVAQITGFSLKQLFCSQDIKKQTQEVETNKQHQKIESNNDALQQIAPHKPSGKQGTNSIKIK